MQKVSEVIKANKVILEIFTDEVGVYDQKQASASMKEHLEKMLEDAGIKQNNMKVHNYWTPRRLVFYIENIPYYRKGYKVEKKGPRSDAPQQAINGFIKSCECEIDDLVILNIKGIDYYYYVKDAPQLLVKDELGRIFKELMRSVKWRKTMLWGSYDTRWIRPVHSILCLFNNEVIDFTYGHIRSGRITQGHRFLSKHDFCEIQENYDMEQL